MEIQLDIPYKLIYNVTVIKNIRLIHTVKFPAGENITFTDLMVKFLLAARNSIIELKQ